MKIVFINGSPKKKKSVSEKIIASLSARMPAAHEYVYCSSSSDTGEILSAIKNADALVFAFPLYVDGLPARLVQFLDEAAKDGISDIAPGAKVYAVVNNGFYEARQNATALLIMKSFCGHSGLSWAQGAGIGAGPMISSVAIGQGPLKRLGRALDTLAENICSLAAAEDLFVEPGIPRFLYNLSGNHMWKKAAKKRGLKVKDLYSTDNFS